MINRNKIEEITLPCMLCNFTYTRYIQPKLSEYKSSKRVILYLSCVACYNRKPKLILCTLNNSISSELFSIEIQQDHPVINQVLQQGHAAFYHTRQLYQFLLTRDRDCNYIAGFKPEAKRRLLYFATNIQQSNLWHLFQNIKIF